MRRRRAVFRMWLQPPFPARMPFGRANGGPAKHQSVCQELSTRGYAGRAIRGVRSETRPAFEGGAERNSKGANHAFEKGRACAAAAAAGPNVVV
jgi:hypothetical protein